MTCVVAVEDGDGVVVGCDAFMGTDIERDVGDRPKWWRVGRALVAFAGSFSVAQTAEGVRARPPPRRKPARAWVLSLAKRYRHACASVTRDEPFLLVAIDGEVWAIQPDWSVVRSAHGYAAIGAGAPVALGALAATVGVDAETRVRSALEASARHTTQVAPPFHVLRV